MKFVTIFIFCYFKIETVLEKYSFIFNPSNFSLFLVFSDRKGAIVSPKNMLSAKIFSLRLTKYFFFRGRDTPQFLSFL